MEKISRKISLEPFTSRYPLCWPSLNELGNVEFINPVSGGTSMAFYGLEPLGINPSSMGRVEYSNFTPEMQEAYGGKVLPYYLLQKWFTSMITYKDFLRSVDCGASFSSMTDYYSGVYGKDSDLGYSNEQDELYLKHGGNKFYTWLVMYYFTMLDLYDIYENYHNYKYRSRTFQPVTDEPLSGVTAFTRSELEEVVDNIGKSKMTYPEAVQFIGKMVMWDNKYYDGHQMVDCSESDDCCDCVDYKAFGGHKMAELLQKWLTLIQTGFSDTEYFFNTTVDDWSVLYPHFDFSVSLTEKIDDLGTYSCMSTDFISGHTYSFGDTCIAKEDVWILSGDTYCSGTFEEGDVWKRYSEWYYETYQNEKSENTQKMTGRTVSSLDDFIRREDTTDILGNVIPGYFKPKSVVNYNDSDVINYVTQPYQNQEFDLIYKVGSYTNEEIHEYRGMAIGTNPKYCNVYLGDYLERVKFFALDVEGTEISSVTYQNESGLLEGLSRFILTIQSDDSSISNYYRIPSDGKIYADFTYYKDCLFWLYGTTSENYSFRRIEGESFDKCMKCVDHCWIEPMTAQYCLSQDESYPIRYYKVYKDIEEHWSDETQSMVKVAMCDFEMYMNNFESEADVVMPLFRKEELNAFSGVETPKDNIYIDRGYATVLDRHQRIGEIKDYQQLEKYGNGIFQIFNADEDVV